MSTRSLLVRAAVVRTAVVFALAVLSGCLEGDPNPLARDDDADQGSSGSGTSGQPAPAPTVEPSGACSTNSSQPVNLPFRNGFTDRSVRLYWVDYGCKEVAYSLVGPGQSHVQQTFVGHPWRVRDEATNALYREAVATSTAPPEVVVP